MAESNCSIDFPPLPVIEGVEIRHCVGFPGYAVGNDGTVWSCRKRGAGCKRPASAWRQRIPHMIHDGHFRIDLYSFNGIAKIRAVHHLVLEAFVGPCPDGHECCHADGDAGNNALANLRWDTHSANCLDAVRHGTFNGLHKKGVHHPASKLTEAAVAFIRSDKHSLTHQTLADIFGVSRENISRVMRRETWQCI